MILPFALTLSLLLTPAPVTSPAGEKASDLIEVSMPRDWIRSEASGLLTFTRRPTDESGFKMVSALTSRPKTGNIRETFLQLWKELAKGVAPEDSLQHHLVPLVMRNSHGVIVAFDGDTLERKPFRAMLYLVDCGDSVVPIIGIFGSDPPIAAISFVSATGPTELAKTMSDMLDKISLKKGKSAESPVFQASDIAGTYHQTMVGSSARYVDRNTGSTVGNASTGGSYDFIFGTDGSYKETSALVVLGNGAGVNTRKGSWKFDGEKVLIHYADGKSPDKKLWMMGAGLNRRGDHSLLYLVDPRYIDKYFFQMFIEGADVSYFYYEKKTD